MTPADLYVGTMRPVNKVDPLGSFRLPSEFLGSPRKEGSASSPIAPPRRASSETARVGGLMVDEVILPILNKVRFTTQISFSEVSYPYLDLRLSGMIWMLERLNR